MKEVYTTPEIEIEFWESGDSNIICTSENGWLTPGTEPGNGDNANESDW